MVTVYTGRVVKLTVTKPGFLSGQWAEENGDPIASVKWLCSKVYIMLKTKSMPDGTKVSIKIKEWEPTWFLKDADVQEYPDIAEIQNNEARIEIQLKDEWYKEEKDQINELYFIASVNIDGQKFKREFNADKAKETLKVVKSEIQSIQAVPMPDKINDEWLNPDDTEERITVSWNVEREYQIKTNPDGLYRNIKSILINGNEKIDDYQKQTGRIKLKFEKRSLTDSDYQTTEIITANGSREFKVIVSMFKSLWDNHPAPRNPCDDSNPDFENQCAMSMGVAIENVGIDTSTFKGLRCIHYSKIYKSHDEAPGIGKIRGHIRSAQALADWIVAHPEIFGNRCNPIIPPDNILNFYDNKNGIIFIQNGWDITDHIDLWDGKNNHKLKRGFISYFDKGKQQWFWEIQ